MKKIDLQRHVPRFWSKVEVRDNLSCWEWRGTTDSYGYGRFFPERGEALKAHRVAYFLWYGEDPGEMCVCHHCDNPPCCNPQHYFLGTRVDNNKDRSAKGRDFVPTPPPGHKPVKLNWEAAREIRQSPLSARLLAKQYGVSIASIVNVRSGRTWRESNAAARALTSAQYEED